MRVLIIDDEPSIRKTTAVALEGMGHDTVSVECGSQALSEIGNSRFDVAFLDLKLAEENGLDLLPEILSADPAIEVVVFTAYSTAQTCLEALHRGATDYLAKPFTPEQLRRLLSAINKSRTLQRRLGELEARLAAMLPAADLSTSDGQVRQIYTLSASAAATSATVLLTSESGAGKSMLARFIHENSPQKDGAFVTVNCATESCEALERELFGDVRSGVRNTHAWGKVAFAEGGTLFLDEIGELPCGLGPKLLRLVQQKEYERVGESKTRRSTARMIASTKRNLPRLVEQGRFAAELFSCLSTLSIQLPPLRERVADLSRIAAGYLEFFAQQCGKRITGFSAAANQALRSYSWPGNLRELRTTIEAAVINASGDQIELIDLPEKVVGQGRRTDVQGSAHAQRP